jgi:hypothetical protein
MMIIAVLAVEGGKGTVGWSGVGWSRFNDSLRNLTILIYFSIKKTPFGFLLRRSYQTYCCAMYNYSVPVRYVIFMYCTVLEHLYNLHNAVSNFLVRQLSILLLESRHWCHCTRCTVYGHKNYHAGVVQVQDSK